MPTAQVGSPTPTSQQAPCRAWGWSSAQKAPPVPRPQLCQFLLGSEWDGLRGRKSHCLGPPVAALLPPCPAGTPDAAS